MNREELEMRTLVRESDVIDRTDGSELAKAFNHLWKKYIEQEPCEDAISRQAVLDIIRFEDKWLLDVEGHNADTEIAFSGIKSKVSHLPPVNPQTETGHWINDKCSICGKGIEDLIDSREWYKNEEPNFCPFCGVKLVELQESEEV